MIDVFSVLSMGRCQISIFDWVTTSGRLHLTWTGGDHHQIVVCLVGLSQQEHTIETLPPASGYNPGPPRAMFYHLTPSWVVGGTK